MSQQNENTRLEAFCDGVFAIAATLLVIELKPPAPDTVSNTTDLWHALHHLAPAIGAFVLSFGVILITWVNHHTVLKLLRRSAPSFIYANGFMLLTVVFIPFPTAMLGEFLLTAYAAPAVVLYNAVLTALALAWVLLFSSAIKHQLATTDAAMATLRAHRRHGYVGLALYALLTVVAVWFPVAAAIVTTMTWLFWLVLSITTKHE